MNIGTILEIMDERGAGTSEGPLSPLAHLICSIYKKEYKLKVDCGVDAQLMV
jgi:hypothetical protein